MISYISKQAASLMAASAIFVLMSNVLEAHGRIPSNYLSAIKGRIYILRPGRNPIVARVGDLLRPEDNLRLDTGDDRSTVLCDNNSSWKGYPVGTYLTSTKCSSYKPPVRSSRSPFDGGPVAGANTGAGNVAGIGAGTVGIGPIFPIPQATPIAPKPQALPQETIPLASPSQSIGTSNIEKSIILILTPRNTSILETKPLFRWNPNQDANCCTVSVKGSEGTWTQPVEMTPDMLENPQIIYGGKTPLKPGNKYQFQVKSNSGAIGLTTFEVLDEITAKRVKAEIAALQKKPIGEEAKVLALATLERENSLHSAAIDRLSKWLSKSSKNPAPYQLLADLYMQIELPEKARSPYITALDLTRKNRNPKEEVKSLREEGELLITLGIVDSALGDRTQSISWLEKAQQLYTKLKDNERVLEVKERLIDARASS
jgi:hypothetical protein